MLNMMWPVEGVTGGLSAICTVKPEPEEPEYHRLSPAEVGSYYYPEAGERESGHQLAALLPLPAFHQPALDTGATSPDSSGGGLAGPGLAPDCPPPALQRKRSNSGSSGSSAGSASCGPSRPKIRRRQPVSQDELLHQRNQGQSLPDKLFT